MEFRKTITGRLGLSLRQERTHIFLILTLSYFGGRYLELGPSELERHRFFSRYVNHPPFRSHILKLRLLVPASGRENEVQIPRLALLKLFVEVEK